MRWDSTQLPARTLLERDHDWKQSWVIEIKCSFYQGSKDTRYTGALVVVMGQKHWADRGGDSNIKKTNNNGREAEKMCFLSGWSCVCVWWRKLTERESGGQYSDWIILVSKWLNVYGTFILIKVNKPYRYESLRTSLNWSSGVWRGGKTSKRLHFRWLGTLMDISTLPWTLLRVEESKIKVLEHKIKCIIRLFSSLLILGGDYIIILLLWASKSYLNDIVWEV